MAKKKKKESINLDQLRDTVFKILGDYSQSYLQIDSHGKLDEDDDNFEKNEMDFPTLCDNSVTPLSYILYISIDKCPVKVFRRLRVPSNLRLEYLAELILTAMGWYGYHLHQFSKNGVLYVSPESFEEDWDFGFRMRRVNAMDYTIFTGKINKFCYS